MTVALALGAAVFYGCSDFIGGVTSRRTSAWSVALMAQVGGSLAVLLLCLVVDGTPTRTDLVWTLVAGLGNGIGTAFLYRGLSSGRMGVIAPISGVGAAVVPVVVGLLLDERPSLLVWVGMLAALPGIWLVSLEPGQGARAGLAEGIIDGVLAGLGFGVLFAALGQIPEEAGLLPLALNQVVAGVVIIMVASLLRVAWVPRQRIAALGMVCGLLGASATGAFMLAAQSGYLTVAAILTSLYPAFTILLAALVLRERVHATQGAGLALCALAVTLVAAG